MRDDEQIQIIELRPDQSCSAAVAERLNAEGRRLIEDVQTLDSVVAAREAWSKATSRKETLGRACAGLNGEITKLNRERAELNARIRGALIARFSGERTDDSENLFDQSVRLSARDKETVAALGHVVEHDARLAEIAEEQTHSEYLFAVARGFEAKSGERLVKTMASLQEAVSLEGELAFDPAKTLSGSFLRAAQEISREAYSHKALAEELLTKYKAFCEQPPHFNFTR